MNHGDSWRRGRQKGGAGHTHGLVPRSGSARPERNGWDMNLFMLIDGETLSKYFPHWRRMFLFGAEFAFYFFSLC